MRKLGNLILCQEWAFLGRYRALSVRNKTFSAYHNDRRSFKADRGPSEAEGLRHFRPMNGLSGLLTALPGYQWTLFVKGEPLWVNR